MFSEDRGCQPILSPFDPSSISRSQSSPRSRPDASSSIASPHVSCGRSITQQSQCAGCPQEGRNISSLQYRRLLRVRRKMFEQSIQRSKSSQVQVTNPCSRRTITQLLHVRVGILLSTGDFVSSATAPGVSFSTPASSLTLRRGTCSVSLPSLACSPRQSLPLFTRLSHRS